MTYYWNTVFGGFAHPAAGNPGPDKSLYKGCKAKGTSTVTIFLNRPSSSFIGALALTNFGIASPTALKKYQADAGTVDSNGVFHPTGTFGTQHPIGTGPYMLKSWSVGDKLVLVANPHYWGKKAKIGSESSSSRSPTTPRGCRHCRPARSRATTWSIRPTSAPCSRTARRRS